MVECLGQISFSQGVRKHPGGPETLLVKIEFTKKCVFFPQRGDNCRHPKSVKFGRPNLGLFWANCVFATAKRDFLLYFDRTIADFFHSIFRSICAVLSSSFLYLLINTSSTAQGGGGSFQNRKPIGEVGCSESWMAEQIY